MSADATPDGNRPWPHQSVLVVDDEPGMISFLQRALGPRCGQVDAADCVGNARVLLRRQHYDLIVLDVSLPGMSGLAWLEELRSEGYAGTVILMTAYADLDTAIHALRAGAADLLLKPFSLAQAMNAVQRCFERSQLARENFVLRREVSQRHGDLAGIVCQSAAMHGVCERIKRIAPTPATVLLQGESGTGKEIAARAIHNTSPRADKPFVPVNCAAIAADLLESELFGHVRGAYTGAQQGREGLFYYARGGTLFLDEITEMTPAAQAKLLRVLEERKIRPVGSEQEIPVDVRVIAATNQDIRAAVEAQRFRQDLFYRLQVVELVLPPLRERPDDIPLLVEHFITQLAPHPYTPRLTPDARTLARMSVYDWPGNVRELRNFVERSLILGDFDFGDAPQTLPHATVHAADDSLEAIEKAHILDMLARADGNKAEAARRLGVSRKTLDRKCQAWGL